MRHDQFLDELAPLELRRLARVTLEIANVHGLEADVGSASLCGVGLLVAEENLIARSFCSCDCTARDARGHSVRVDS